MIYNVKPSLTDGLSLDEICDGVYRQRDEFIIRLAQFYLCLNEKRIHKLKDFGNLAKKCLDSQLFALSTGGDLYIF